ncbi:MAG: hypothetical protein S0880_27800, partial [Actinomycetota bacterium]|nr:hypothetical protein [Actinomycetota bacterium]
MRRRLVVLFLAVGTLPLAIVGAVVTGSSYVSDRAQSLSRQQAFTEDLVAEFETAIDEEIADVRTVTRIVGLAPDDEGRSVAMG